jgi:hypothetical protein
VPPMIQKLCTTIAGGTDLTPAGGSNVDVA